ncbi:MAG: DUF2798 domain-containing protein [Paraglaciecola sp.]|uniref:DUF2798 domain-containing protein n=1 Tax=Paraglaciecola sp. TaxID=1920173 RepID=UPI0032997F57
MISRKYSHYVFVATMAMGMTLVLSFVATANNEGFSSLFVFAWLRTIGWSFCIAFPTALLMQPLAKWVTEILVT